MARPRKDEAAEAQADEAAADEKAPEPSDGNDKYSIERLTTDAQGFFGVPSHVAVGALHGIEDDLTVGEAQARINEWLKKPASPAAK